jgi:hypothetical protein
VQAAPVQAAPGAAPGQAAPGTAPAQAAPGAAAPSNPHIASANLFTLAERSVQGATARERMDFDREMTDHSIQTQAGQPSLSARAMGDVMRAAPLTMNIDTNFLFGDSPILTQPESRVPNYYHLAREAQAGNRSADSLPGRIAYTATRDAVETLVFPELGEHGMDNPDARPTYAALNVDRNELGGASMYGGSYLVLKPEVAQRATYTADDTFYAIPASFTPERRENFYNRLGALSEDIRFPPKFIADARDPTSQLHRDFEAYFDGLAADPQTSTAALKALPTSITGRLKQDCDAAGISEMDGRNYVQGSLIASFGDGAQARARTATYDSLETLLPGMATPAFNSLARAALQKTPAVGLMGTNYIEAQIQGGIVPTRDIAEIRVQETDFNSPADLQAARARAAVFTQNTGIPVTFFSPTEAAVQQSIETKTEAVKASRDFNAEHLSRDRLDAEIVAVRSDPLTAIDRLLADPSRGLNLLPANVRNLQGAALTRVLDKTEALAQEWARKPPSRAPIPSENLLVKQAFSEAATPVLQQKAALLAKLDTLQFDNEAQKKAFTQWVMSTPEISSPEELSLIHANAVSQAKALRAIADADTPPPPEEVTRGFAAAMRNANNTKEIDSIASMAVALLRNQDGGEEALSKLADRMTSPEQMAFAGQMKRVEEGAKAGTLVGNAGELDLLSSTNHLMDSTRRSVCKEAGRASSSVTPFIGELSLLPQGARTLTQEIAPSISTELERSHPAYPAFPPPANPDALPQNEAERRQFLVDLLHPDGTYVEHEKTFERGAATHGRGHIARAWIFAEAMCNIMGEMGVEVDRNAVLCGIAGHDMGRQGGGQDRWEGRSADMLTEGAMGTAFGAQNMGDDYQKEVNLSIDAHKSQTLEGSLLNAADSLDIGRTTAFNPEHFAFLRGKPGETPSPEALRMREQLAREANLLQRLTNPKNWADPALDHLAEEMRVDGKHTETLMAQHRELMEGVRDAYAQRWSESGEEYMHSVEDAIRMNPDMFPVLSKYYTQPMDAAMRANPSPPANADRINVAVAQTGQARTDLVAAQAAAKRATQLAQEATTRAAAPNADPALAAAAQEATHHAAAARSAVAQAETARAEMMANRTDPQVVEAALRTISEQAAVARTALDSTFNAQRAAAPA